jgi:lysophospholipase L1-like esterase
VLASITAGYGSSDENGYRQHLWKHLEKGNNSMAYIGSQTRGNMIHKHHEGHPGFKVASMLDVSKETVKQRPNVILLFVGTNDMDPNMGKDQDKAPGEMGDTIDGLVKACPDAAILVAQITTSTTPKMAENIAKYDEALVPIVKKRTDAGKHVYLVDMSKLLDIKTDFHDDRHPNDVGHKKLAAKWYEALNEVDGKGWIRDPVLVDGQKYVSEGGHNELAVWENQAAEESKKGDEKDRPSSDGKTEDATKTEDAGSDGKNQTETKARRSARFHLMN